MQFIFLKDLACSFENSLKGVCGRGGSQEGWLGGSCRQSGKGQWGSAKGRGREGRSPEQEGTLPGGGQRLGPRLSARDASVAPCPAPPRLSLVALSRFIFQNTFPAPVHFVNSDRIPS